MDTRQCELTRSSGNTAVEQAVNLGQESEVAGSYTRRRFR
jgi:hypothetical protein